MPGSVDIPIIQSLPVTGCNGVRCKGSPVRFPWDLVLLGSAAMHHSVRSPVTHRATHARPHARTRTLNKHAHTHGTDACVRHGRGIAMERRRGRTDIWPEVNDVSNLTLLDKILRDGRGGWSAMR